LATGTVITVPGFLQVYREDTDEEEGGGGDESRLPRLSQGQDVACEGLTTEGHETRPPARYTEASLVRRLEELGVGRPSTYASIIQTIQDRGYVWRKGTALVPSFTAFAVVGLMEHHFANLVDYGFTASMEDDLDEIAAGTEEYVPWLERFYFGESRHLPREGASRQPRHALAVDGTRGLKDAVLAHLEEIDAREVNSITIGADADGEEIVVRVGRYGPYLQHGEGRAQVPDDLAPDELTVERALELLSKPSGDRLLGTDPLSGKPVLARAGRFGPYVQLGEAGEDAAEKPRTASMFASMSVDTISLEDALRLLELPRTVGADPDTGAEIVAMSGRYGPYLKKGEETRSLDSEDQLFTVSLEEALGRFAQPKQRRYGVSAAPLRELGPDPVSGGQIALRSGRFGPYVTDGTVNASLRRGDDPETITPARAAELIQARREAGPSTRGRGAKKAGGVKKAGGAKKAGGVKKAGAAKKAVAKKSAGTKKATAKKSPGTKKAAGPS
jgi:DNA topoisomerase-1